MDSVDIGFPGEASSFAPGTGGISPLSLRLRAFFFGVVDPVLTGVLEAEERGEPTLISIVPCKAGGIDDLDTALEKGEDDGLLMSLTSSRAHKLLPFCGCGA